MTISFNTLFGQRDVRETQTTTPSKTYYLTIDGSSFNTGPTETTVTRYSGQLTISVGGSGIVLGVNLPQGAIIQKAVVYGNAAAEDTDWYLGKVPIAGGDGIGITGAIAINTEKTITYTETVENNLYTYSINSGSLDAGDIIYSARITYII